MGVSLDGKLVVAISSRALFNFEEENRVFEQNDDRAYMDLQLARLEQPAPPGVAFSLVKKLLAFNRNGDARVEVVILSRLRGGGWLEENTMTVLRVQMPVSLGSWRQNYYFAEKSASPAVCSSATGTPVTVTE